MTFTLDARHPRQADYDALHDTHARLMTEVAARRGLAMSTEVQFDLAPTPCDPAFMAALARSAQAQGIPIVEMASGAGHDSQLRAGTVRWGWVSFAVKMGAATRRKNSRPLRTSWIASGFWRARFTVWPIDP